MNYTYQYRDQVSADQLSQELWDLFISAYNTTERVTNVFNSVKATQKDWIIHQEYRFNVELCTSRSIHQRSFKRGRLHH